MIGVADEYAGRRIRCNKCNQHSIVPKETDSQVQPAAASSIRSEKKVAKMSTPTSINLFECSVTQDRSIIT